MSNSETKRVIQIKQIELPVDEEQISYQADLQAELAELHQAKADLEAIQQQREILLADTDKEIQAMRESWETEKLKLMEAAKETGYQEGFAQGKEESITQYQELLEQANSIIIASKKDYEATIEKSEESILMLGLQVAEKVIKQQLKDDPASFVPIVKDAISTIKDQRVLSIYLHPDHYEYVLSQKSELERILEKKAELSIYVNESLEAGSCVIEHPFGKIDASVDTQLSQIQHVLHEIVMENKE
ncbi:flagellar assembly protein FliH [Ornithinibacillus contaminans]|uniref:flagellar assembly protein FliH n=1 Tax=Ornithinibacillus contaminans TaxID=694055 RepID=UPI00064DEA12|nr:flagellar assembly protein FliH [Ornithinibacillus contaminans]